MERIVRLFVVVAGIIGMVSLWEIGRIIYNSALLQFLVFGGATLTFVLYALFGRNEELAHEKTQPRGRVTSVEELVIPQGPPEAQYSARTSEAQLIAKALNSPVFDYRIHGKTPNNNIH